MLKNIKKYVYKKLLSYHLKKSDHYYSKIDEWNADNNIYWGNKTAREADEELQNYILKAVTEDFSYSYMKTRLNIPCGRDMFYEKYRRFFWLLDKTRDDI